MSGASNTDSAGAANQAPVISIGMPVFNAGRYLRSAVLSILRQSFGRWELIIIDDASSDGSLDSVRDLDDPRIRIIEGANNLGLAARLNEAVGLAKGKYFARMDQDDISHPERLERQLRFLESHPEVDVVGSRCLLVNVESQPLGILLFPTEHEQICRCPWRGVLLPHPTWMGRTQWFQRNPYRSPGPYFCEDQELLLRTHRSARFALLPETCLAYRVRGPIAIGKLLRTRATLAGLQVRNFLGHWELLDTLKAVVFFMAKCAHDWLGPIAGWPARSSHGGVPLVKMTDSEQMRWKGILTHWSAS